MVTNRELSEKLDWPEGTEILVMEGMEEGQENVRLPEVSPKDSAYIIMTSGSKNIVSTVDSLMSWNYQSVEKILNQLTKMHFRTAKLSETLLLAIKAR